MIDIEDRKRRSNIHTTEDFEEKNKRTQLIFKNIIQEKFQK